MKNVVSKQTNKKTMLGERKGVRVAARFSLFSRALI